MAEGFVEHVLIANLQPLQPGDFLKPVPVDTIDVSTPLRVSVKT